jgi:hypothetical protein
MRIVPVSPTTLRFPISMLSSPVVRFSPALLPNAIFRSPVVLRQSASKPLAVLLPPVVLLASARKPLAVFATGGCVAKERPPDRWLSCGCRWCCQRAHHVRWPCCRYRWCCQRVHHGRWPCCRCRWCLLISAPAPVAVLSKRGEFMNRAEFDELDEPEKRHFYACKQCGELVDKRQLNDVTFHEDHVHRPDIQLRWFRRARQSDGRFNNTLSSLRENASNLPIAQETGEFAHEGS